MGSLYPPWNGHASHPTSPRAARNEQSQWLFTAAELGRTPSILEGLSPTQELTNRAKGVNFITQVGIALKLPQLTLATASVYLHRFFMRHAMPTPTKPGIHHYSVAATALFLATKVEENCRKMKELVVACCRVAQKKPDLVVDEQDKEFWRWRDTLLSEEDRLLEALCFDLALEQPYKILFDFMCYYNVQDNKRLRNASWAFLNDSLNTTMCLRFPARLIAGVALYGGAMQADVQLPDDRNGRPWWEHLELDILDIKDAWTLMADSYENATLPQQGEKGAYSKSDEFLLFDKTRSATSPGYAQSPAPSAIGSQAGMKHDRDEIDQDTSWGSPTKRQRRESREEFRQVQSMSSRIPPEPPNGTSVDSRMRPDKDQPRPAQHPTAEDPAAVQRRIDSIVNASTANHPLPPHPSSRVPSYPEQPYPPLSRISSNQDRVPQIQRTTSSSSTQTRQANTDAVPGDYDGISNRQRPPSSQGSGYGEYRGGAPMYRGSSGGYAEFHEHPQLPRRPSFEDRRNDYDQERRRSHEYHADERFGSQQDRYSGVPNTNGRRISDGRIPDTGSEEGEL